jgi:drug/metabolite transporter (DMT)-like permease
LLRIAVHDGVLAAGFGFAGVRRGGRGSWLKLAAGAVVMFAVPEVLFAAAGGHVSGLSEILVYLLVPVAVIFVAAQRAAGFGAEQNPLALLGPALAALAGAALAIQFAWPPTLAGQLWLGAMVASAVAAGWAAVWMHELLAGADVPRAAAVMFGSSGAVAGALCWVGWSGAPMWDGHAVTGEVVRLVVVEAPILLLTVWLLREMKPVAFSARFFVIPLVTIVESYAVLRPPVSWTTWVGVVLLAGGAAVMLRVDSREML